MLKLGRRAPRAWPLLGLSLAVALTACAQVSLVQRTVEPTGVTVTPAPPTPPAEPSAPSPHGPIPIQPQWLPADYPGDTIAEERILALTNQHRRAAGAPEVLPEQRLRVAARQHSREMLDRGYFAHESPVDAWRDLTQRAYLAGYWEAGGTPMAENLAMFDMGRMRLEPGDLAERTVNGWLNSPGHRRNLLNPEYTYLGVGVVSQGGCYYATQVFGKHTFRLTDLSLQRVRNRIEISGTATVLPDAADQRTVTVRVAVDGVPRQVIEAEVGEPFAFRAAVPEDSERHRIGLYPSAGGRRFWVKDLFHLDTSQALSRMLVPPAGADAG